MFKKVAIGGLILSLTACSAHNPPSPSTNSTPAHDKIYDTRIVVNKSCGEPNHQFLNTTETLVQGSFAGIFAPIVVDKLFDWTATAIKKLGEDKKNTEEASAPVLILEKDGSKHMVSLDREIPNCVNVIQTTFPDSDKKNRDFFFAGKLVPTTNAVLIEPITLNLKKFHTSSFTGKKHRDLVLMFTLKNEKKEVISQSALAFKKIKENTELTKNAFDGLYSDWMVLSQNTQESNQALADNKKPSISVANLEVQIIETSNASKFMKAIAEIFEEGKSDLKTLIQQEVERRLGKKEES